MLDQQWIDIEAANQMVNVDIKRFMLGRKLGVPPMLLNESLVARTMLQEGIAPPSEFYAIHVVGDVEPLLVGPFDSVVDRDNRVGELRLDYGDDDGIYPLNIVEGIVTVGAYLDGEMEAFVEGAEVRRDGARLEVAMDCLVFNPNETAKFFVVAAGCNGNQYLRSYHLDRSSANDALKKTIAEGILSVIPASIEFSSNGNVRRWDIVPD
jgi:hypothetical protein